jgi:putative DNA methylase
MSWDFAEANVFSSSTGSWDGSLEWIPVILENLPANIQAKITQSDATATIDAINYPIISTDPPYYDNIHYADLSDFFYIWLRRTINDVYPSLFTTLLTPKKQESIASSYRHDGDEDKAKKYFEQGLSIAFEKIHHAHNYQYPLTIYYGFKQTETNNDGNIKTIASTGWETMLEGVRHAGFSIIGTWPMHTEREKGLKSSTNSLASSIVLVCRPRPSNASIATRREFILALKNELPPALHTLKQGNIAPVDLAQAMIGPGMAIFTRYSKVLEADGSTMIIRTALGLINQTLDELLIEQEGDFDVDTRWAVSWFEQYGMNEGPFGDAETLSKAKNTAIDGLAGARIINAQAGKVKLITWRELPANWDPDNDSRPTVWSTTQHLIRALDINGENGAAEILSRIDGGMGENARDLAYRLYSICERKKWTQDAITYNSLITSWPQIVNIIQSLNKSDTGQQLLFEQ